MILSLHFAYKAHSSRIQRQQYLARRYKENYGINASLDQIGEDTSTNAMWVMVAIIITLELYLIFTQGFKIFKNSIKEQRTTKFVVLILCPELYTLVNLFFVPDNNIPSSLTREPTSIIKLPQVESPSRRESLNDLNEFLKRVS